MTNVSYESQERLFLSLWAFFEIKKMLWLSLACAVWYALIFLHIMTSIDIRDAEVQQHFTALRRAQADRQRDEEVVEITKLYDRSDEYSYGIFARIIKFISESGDKEDRRIGLMVLSALGERMEGTARSNYVNKFHSPVFKLMEENLEEALIPFVERAYQTILEMGGNRNDSAVEGNLSACLGILQTGSSKDVRKMGAYATLRILVASSPYITFKKLLQKQKSSNLDNLSLAIASARVRNLKVRLAYLQFLVEYVKYIAEKKDQVFQKATFERFYENYSHITAKESNEETNHLYIETVSVFLKYLTHTIPVDRLRLVLEYSLQKIQATKTQLIERSLVLLLPRLTLKRPSDEVVSSFLRYLRAIEGELAPLAQNAINEIIEALTDRAEAFLPIFRNVLAEMAGRLRGMLRRELGYEQAVALAVLQIRTVDLLLKKFEGQSEALVGREQLEEIVSCAMVVRLDEQTVKLISLVTRSNLHGLERVLEIKLIHTISKVLTGSTRKLLRQTNQDFRQFIELLEGKEAQQFLESEENKVKAIEALSLYRFREQFRELVGGFVKDRILKYYLQWGNSKMKMASVETAFFLYAKKGKTLAFNQLLEVLDKLLRVGLTDSDERVREKVFMSVARNFKRHEQFLHFFMNIELLSYLFQAIEDRNEAIRLWALRIVCILFNRNPSVLITPYLKQYTYNCFYHLSSNFKYYKNKPFLIRSIAIIVELAPAVIENQVDSLLQLLLAYLNDRTNYEGLELLFFQLVRALAAGLPDSLVPYAELFSRHLVEAMKDKLNTKTRQVALKTFINIIKHCGYVVMPYFQIDALKDTLAYLIRSEIEQESRNDIMRIIGALGAVDNLRFSMILNGCGPAVNPESLSKSLQKWGSKSNFLTLRERLAVQRQNNEIEKQLKMYYDELVLLENNKQLMLLNKQEGEGGRGVEKEPSSPLRLELQSDSSTNFHMIILKSLFQILNDKSLSEKHGLTLDILNQMFAGMGGELQKQVPRIMQVLLRLARSNQEMLNSIYLLGEKCDIGEWVGEVVVFLLRECGDLWLMIRMLKLLTGKYKQRLRHLIESIIDKLHFIMETQTGENLMIEVSLILQNLLAYLEPYLSIILPQVLHKFFRKHSETANAFIDLLMSLTQVCPSILQYMPLIAHHFSLLLALCWPKHQACKPCLRGKLCNCIVLFIITFKREFISYLPMLHKPILRDDDAATTTALYFKAIRYLENCSYGNIASVFTPEELARITPELPPPFTSKFQNPKYLKRVQGVEEVIHEFDPLGKKIMEEDWMEWLKKTSILLLKKSPSELLRGCAVLAQEYNELGLQLYNLSFYHFWEVLLDEQKKLLVDNIKRILTYNPKPFLLVRKTFLALAEFMNRKKCSFELSSSLLADCAGDSSSFAKQLYYKQLEFEANPERTIESLIDTYMRLGEPENAYGLFSIAQSLDIKCKIEWYQKIGRFEEAYRSYRDAKDDRLSKEKVKCLSHLSDDRFVAEFEQLPARDATPDLALLAVEAYAHLQEWGKCEGALERVDKESTSREFWTSVLDVRRGEYKRALTHINSTRQRLYESIPDLLNFSSTSEGFEKFLTMQQLFELEEIVLLKEREGRLEEMGKELDESERARLGRSFTENCEKLRRVWSDRLIGCSKNSSTYKNLSVVRSLLFDKAQYFEFYYQLCEIYIRERNIARCEHLIREIKAQLQPSQAEQQKLLHLLEIKISFSDGLIRDLEPILKIQTFLQQHTQLHPARIGELYYLSAMALYDHHPEGETNQAKILELLEQSATLAGGQKEWYIFSTMNLQFAEGARTEVAEKCIESALGALINSLRMPTDDFYLQGYLKLLSLLCNHARLKRIYELFLENHRRIPVEGWINVVPQMIAQLFQPSEESNFVKLIKLLLKNIGEQHPQSVLYSLNFAAKSKMAARTRPAGEIIAHIKERHLELASEVERISSELGRAAIKLKEYWYDGIEAAWAAYNQTKSSAQIVHQLRELCETVLTRNESNSEVAFHQQFGQEIREGYNWLLRFQETQQPLCLAQVFETFFGIYKKVKDSFENIRKIYLKNVAPYLLTSQKYRSTIPGLYAPGKDCVRVTGFANELQILQSKQRPRKLTVLGSDGKQYNFLLKGRQDLRLDERVMQFFSLVNKLLAAERQNLRRELQITRYSIIPLTVNTGLIGWVQDCDTLNELIKEYRTLNKIRVYVEKELYEKMSPDYAYLPVINKLEIFKNGLESTQGKDLQKILCIKSPNSEVWVDKRNHYTCSLATMSMVGYILGLGDRHPSNIMLQRYSGNIVHIDFGDCFQVAVLRQKFPEKVPFRLTRMLQKAMGIPGIHGLYRVTCEMVMKILRDNKESLFGVLETFAQDPIISWRLTNDKKQPDPPAIDPKRQIQEQMIGSIMEQLSLEINNDPKDAHIDQSPRRARESEEKMQQINEKAVNALLRVKQKLRGTDFQENKQLTVEEQVSRLIKEATSAANICQSWPGWCPFW